MRVGTLPFTDVLVLSSDNDLLLYVCSLSFKVQVAPFVILFYKYESEVRFMLFL